MISMYHAHISDPLQQYTLTEFTKTDSVIRVLVCTIAFGMSIEIPDIRRVVHWGPTSSLLSFRQEFGSGGRDGKPATATWYARGKPLNWYFITLHLIVLNYCTKIKSMRYIM